MDWKRRPTPWKRASGSTISAGSTPSARQAAIAASALATLWRPGTGRPKPTPATVKRLASGSSPTSSPRTSAPGPKPNTLAPAASAARLASSPATNASRVRRRKVANIPLTSSISRWSRCRLSTTPTAGS